MTDSASQEHAHIPEEAKPAWRRELRTFIAGTGQFENPRGDPQVECNRWNELVSYYCRLDDGSPEKQIIRQTIVDLIHDPDPEVQYASAALSRILELPEFGEKVVTMVRNGEFARFSQIVREAMLYVVTRLEVDELSEHIVEHTISLQKLRSYLLWNTRPLHRSGWPRGWTVTPNDYWRMEALARYYRDHADEATRTRIAEQMRGQADRHPELGRIFEAFVRQHECDCEEFLALLQAELDAVHKSHDE